MSAQIEARARTRSSAASIAASCSRSCRPAAHAMRSTRRCGISKRSGPARRCGSWRASRGHGRIATCVTIGIRSIAEYEARARAADALRVDQDQSVGRSARWRPLQQSVAARRTRAWSSMPIRRGAWKRCRDSRRRSRDCAWTCWSNRSARATATSWRVCDLPVPVCADEPANTVDDLPRLIDCYDFVNIKLDKSGGLTAALDLAHAARAAGLRLMVGCMVGGSLAMAPAMVVAQLCEIADLDGPLLQAEDWPDGNRLSRRSDEPALARALGLVSPRLSPTCRAAACCGRRNSARSRRSASAARR